jgi:hypothetical protein
MSPSFCHVANSPAPHLLLAVAFPPSIHAIVVHPQHLIVVLLRQATDHHLHLDIVRRRVVKEAHHHEEGLYHADTQEEEDEIKIRIGRDQGRDRVVRDQGHDP